MRRETTNKIRFVIEDLLPPLLRDTTLFRKIAELVWGRHIHSLADFRKRAPFLTAEEYETLYRVHPRVHADTDNSEATVQKIIADVVGGSVCDVGCGTGYLLSRVRDAHSGIHRLVGVDFVLPEDSKVAGVEFRQAMIERLPFADAEFDTVVCTHVVEHILDYRAAIAELRRIAARRLIIVVPREREGRYTFNPHFNFFPYPESFLRAAIPIPRSFECIEISRDIYYREDRQPPQGTH
jgi:SAM-dependent methyltransferase